MKLGLGTAAIGRPHYINIRSSPNQDIFHKDKFINEGIAMLSHAYAKGIRHFDTAPGYGIAEEIILKWIKLEKPQNITISTKWGYTYVANFDKNALQHEIKEHSINKLNEQWAFSKQLLPYLNIYQIHSATFDSGVLTNSEVHKRLFELKLKYGLEIGLSVSGEDQNKIIEKALAVKINNQSLFTSFQVTYNVFDQSLLGIIDQLKGKKIIIKEALANGRIFPNENYKNHQQAYSLLENLSVKYQTSIDAIAISFINQTIDPYSTLSGASEKEQLKSNLKSEIINLSSEDISAIKKLAISPNKYWNERKQLAWN